jgi:hypothetical protein
MALESGGQPAKFIGPARFQALDVRRHHGAQTRITDVFETRFQPGDVRFHLLDERQLVAEPIEARIGRLCFLGIEDVGAARRSD